MPEPITIHPFFRVVLTRLRSEEKWSIVSNPAGSVAVRNASEMLFNECNDYVEYANCGCIYRMVRAKDLHRYLDNTNINPAWALDPLRA